LVFNEDRSPMNGSILGSLKLDRMSREYLENVRKGLSLAADLHRSDMFIYVPENFSQAIVLAHARPHSMASLYPEEQTGRRVYIADVPIVEKVMHLNQSIKGSRKIGEYSAPLQERAYPLRDRRGRLVGVLVIETNLIEVQRLKLRSRVFRHALNWILRMLIAGDFGNVVHIAPFGEVDGLILVDSTRTIRYISGRGSGIYRRLGYLSNLVGQHLRQLENEDDRMVIQAFSVGRPLQFESEERGRYLVKSVLPIHVNVPLHERIWLRVRDGWRGPTQGRVWMGALLIVRDVTEERRSKEELRAKSMLLREVHHRVKNNLQTIASILRMQARRVDDETARHYLLRAASRVRAVADIHEFLQYQEGQSMVGLRELVQQVWRQIAEAVIPDDMNVEFSTKGPNIWLVGQQATAMALVINELVLNAIEHGTHNHHGTVLLRIMDLGPMARVEVINPHDHLADNFDLDQQQGLGLNIVRTLVQNELGGSFRLYSSEEGVVAEVTFQKRVPPGASKARGD